jgi:hypothetical protein
MIDLTQVGPYLMVKMVDDVQVGSSSWLRIFSKHNPDRKNPLKSIN